MIPPWDFNATAPAIYSLDSSSALVAASGFVELSTYSTSAPKRDAYLEAANRIVDSVTSGFVFSPSESDSVVKNGTSYYPNTGIPLIYGALARVCQWQFFWLRLLHCRGLLFTGHAPKT